MMKFEKLRLICFLVSAFFLSPLQSDNQVDLNDPNVIKQQTEDTSTFVSIVNVWEHAREKYFQKNDINPEIKCKNCTEGILSLGEFDGCMLAWIIKAIPDGHDAFEKIKQCVEVYIKLFSDNASSEELINFMLKTSNEMKQICTHCHGVVWEKIT